MLVADGTLDPEGPAAESIADLWWLLLGLGTVVFVAVAVLLVGGLFRRRHAAGPDGPDRPDAGGETPAWFHRWVIGGGVVMPVVVLMVVLGATVWTMRDVSGSAPRGALEVEIVGHQWWWEVRYPEDGVTTANELHIPVGRPVAIELTSADVIHSFWVPELAGKLDALPDGTNTLVIEADEPGEYRTECAEFCGLQHAQMVFYVVADPPVEFAQWLDNEATPAGPTSPATVDGRNVFLGSSCAGCHTIRGTSANGDEGPDLTHVAQRQTIAGVLRNTRDNLRLFITHPQRVKPGAIMPPTELTTEEVDVLLDYLQSLN
jgi:cytochrome c oxidase subunit II